MQVFVTKGCDHRTRDWLPAQVGHGVLRSYSVVVRYWLVVQVSHEAYLMQTAEHSATFRELSETDSKAARVIETRMHTLLRLQVRASACLQSAL